MSDHFVVQPGDYRCGYKRNGVTCNRPATVAAVFTMPKVCGCLGQNPVAFFCDEHWERRTGGEHTYHCPTCSQGGIRGMTNIATWTYLDPGRELERQQAPPS